MSSGPLIFLCVNALVLMLVPRRWAPLPFIMTACYLSISEAIELGPLTFTAIRILVAVGIVRVAIRKEHLVGGLNGLDGWMIAWSIWACVSAVVPGDERGSLVTRLGLVYNSAGTYFLIRRFCSSLDDVIALCRATAILLIPVGLEMLYEIGGSPSVFRELDGSGDALYVRGERIRAFGPFAHPILAGTVGAVCLPMMVAIWNHRRAAAVGGGLACLAIVGASASSGPVFSALAAVAGLAMWPHRARMPMVRRVTILVIVALALSMKAPVYYLIARVGLVAGSTGYHRALLIDSAVVHLDEWWLAGTDYTRHWAPSPGWSPAHTDITNQYLSMGVLGGLPLMLLFIAAIAKAFSLVGVRLREQPGDSHTQDQFVLWALGSMLFAHAITFLSVSYFDQSFVFIYLMLAAIGSARIVSARSVVAETAGAESLRSRFHVRVHRSRPRCSASMWGGLRDRAAQQTGVSAARRRPRA